MTTSPIWGLPFVESQQAQPELILNRSLIMLQALQTPVEDQLNAPPGSPDDGQCWIVGETPTGAFAGRANKIAIYYGGWIFVPGVDSDGLQIAMGDEHIGLAVWNKAAAERWVWQSGSVGWAPAP